MKDVIEAGEYVRTENGKIDKVVSNNYYMEKYIEAEKDFIFCNSIVKHRKQLIDLIDVGDILKIKISEEWVEKQDTIKFVVVGQTYTITEIKECLENGLFKIIQILTKESYMANCYKVEGE